jgi:hypothetical protein
MVPRPSRLQPRRNRRSIKSPRTRDPQRRQATGARPVTQGPLVKTEKHADFGESEYARRA